MRTSAPAMPALRARTRTRPEATFAKLRDVANAHCGIVTRIERFDVREPSLRGTFGYAATLETATALGYWRFRGGAGQEFWRTGLEGRAGTRVAFDRTRAFVRAAGEALERYACCTYEPASLVHGSWRERSTDAFDPRRFQLPSADEYARLPGLAPFDEDAPMRWRWAWRLPDGEPRLVPAQFCYVMYNALPSEPRLAPPTSTGWAVHHTREEAIHAALREVVERDSFFLVWLNRLRVPTLDLERGVTEPAVRRYLDAMQEGGARVRVLVTTTDLGVPSFAVAAHDPRPGRPAFLLTLAAHPDPAKALRQAVEEAAMMRLDLTARVRTDAARPVARMEDVEEMGHHAEYYLDPSHLAPVRWLLDETERIRLDELAGFGAEDVWAEVLGMTTRIRAAGYETLYVDGTPPDLAEAGWHAAKLLVPGSVRHEYGHGIRLLACPRIYEAPVRMRARATPSSPAEINPDVHPYA